MTKNHLYLGNSSDGLDPVDTASVPSTPPAQGLVIAKKYPMMTDQPLGRSLATLFPDLGFLSTTIS